jgi:hypothetical protein
VVLEYEAIDRMYLNVYVPQLQTVGATVGYLHVQHGQRFASTTAVAPMSDAFVRNIEEFVVAEELDLVTFHKNERKDAVTQKRLRKFKKCEGVLYVGKAQEKARVMRTVRRRCSRTGATHPWIVESTAMVNHYYFYSVDEDFGAVLPEILLILSLQREALHQRARVLETPACQAGDSIRRAGQRHQVLCQP